MAKGILIPLVGLCVVAIGAGGLLNSNNRGEKSADSRGGEVNTSAMKKNEIENTMSKEVFSQDIDNENRPFLETDALALPEQLVEMSLIEKDGSILNIREYTDSVGAEGRLFASATAHMSDRELVAFRDLRTNNVVQRSDGVLNPPYESIKSCENADQKLNCLDKIINVSTKQVVFNGRWIAGFRATGVGKEVVRVK